MMKFIQSLKYTTKKWIEKQYFNPDILGVFISPTYLVRRSLIQNIATQADHITGRVLDIGCGSKPYQPLFKNVTEYIGMEYDTPENRKRNGVDVFYDGETFPFPDDSFDSVLATEVLEHVFNPDLFLSEIHRVLKKKTGILFLSCPLMWMEHQRPYDYGRYTSFGITRILKKQAFEILWQGRTVSGGAAIFQLIASYIRTKLRVKNYYFQIFLYSLCISPFTILGIMASKFSSQDSPVFIGNVVLVKKV